MNIFYNRFLILCFFVALISSSCKKKEYQTIVEMDEENIQNYIRQNNLDMTPFGTTGMYYQIIEEGTGSPLDYKVSVPVIYTFRTHDGSFSSVDTFSTSNRYADFLGYFPYGSTVANSQPGSPLDKEDGLKSVLKQVLKQGGGKIRVLVPSRLAYGRNGSGQIGSNQCIDYMIHTIAPESLSLYEENSIKDYIPVIGMQIGDFEVTPTGIYYNIIDAGTGEQILSESMVHVSYTLKLLNGSIVEQTADPIPMLLSSTIAGWKEILPKLKAGGKVRMLIPSAQAYGLLGSVSPTADMASIPAFSTLDFEVSVATISQ